MTHPRRGNALLACGAAVALAIGAAACGGSENEGGSESGDGPIEVRLAHLNTATHLPILVADAQGFFEDEGLEVERTVVTDVSNLPGAMGRQFDFGSTTMLDVIKTNQQGIDVALVWNLAVESSDNPVVSVVAGPDTEIESAEDLVGKTVGVGGFGGNIHPSTLFWLNEQGVDAEEINFVSSSFPEQPDQLLAGRIDAAEAIEPFRSQMTEGGGEVIIDNLVYVSDPASSVSTMADRQWAEDNPDAVIGMTNALGAAAEFIESNEAEAREILAEYADIPIEIAEGVTLPGYDTAINEEELRRWAEVAEVNGELEGSVDEVDYEALTITAEQLDSAE